jgi:outer membrane protein
MNKIFLCALSLVVAGLFTACNNNEKAASQNSFALPTDSTGVVVLPIAYINVDTLLVNYQFAKDMNEILQRKQEDARLAMTQRVTASENQVKLAQSKLEKEAQEFREKAEKGIFATPERAQSEQARLMKQEQDLQALNQRLSTEIQSLQEKLTQDMMAEQQKMDAQFKDSLDSALATYNADKRFHIIFSNVMNNNILYADQQYDITRDVLNLLNSRYVKEQ